MMLGALQYMWEELRGHPAYTEGYMKINNVIS